MDEKIKWNEEELLFEAALVTVISDSLMSHKNWWDFRWPLFDLCRKSLMEFPPHTSKTAEKGRKIWRLVLDIDGRFLDVPTDVNDFKNVHETTEYDGCVSNSSIVLDYHATTYLAPGVLSDDEEDRVFRKHRFCKVPLPASSDPFAKTLCNILEVHEQRGRKCFNHDLAWSMAMDNVSSN